MAIRFSWQMDFIITNRIWHVLQSKLTNSKGPLDAVVRFWTHYSLDSYNDMSS